MEDLSSLIRTGEASSVRALLDRSPEVLHAPIDGAPTPLLLAAYYSQPAVVEVLRQYLPKLTLHEAAAVGDLHELERELGQHPDLLDAFSPDGFTPLGFAAYFNHAQAVDRLLQAGANPNVRSQNPLGVSPLHSALAGGHKEVAARLLDAGADAGLASASGWTPAHYVAFEGDYETAQRLLAIGAPLDRENGEGKTPADLAREHGHTDLAERFEALPN